MPLILTIGMFGGLVLLFLGSGMYIGAALAGGGIIGFELLVKMPTMIIGITIYNVVASYTMAAMLLFLFMGWLVFYSGISENLYSGASKWTSIIPGGLLHANIVSCALFAAISGSSVATAGTLGAVAYPAQKARGYSRGIVTGSLAAGGTLGILIPPSITMIVYGTFVGASIGRLFMGGVFPGIILALAFMVYIGIRITLNPALAEPRQRITRHYFLDAILAFKEVWSVVVIMVTILGGIYTGIMTPTEAAGISCFEAVILAAVFRKLNFTLLKNAALHALETTAMIMFIMIGAKVLGQALSMLKIPAQLCEMIAATEVSPLIIWLSVAILYLIMGCFIDGISILLLTLPVTFPLLTSVGFDPIWFGVVATLLNECALVTPPVGDNVYIIHAVTGGTDIAEVFKGIMPFLICMLLVLSLLTFVPDIVLWLPNQMLGAR